MNNRFIDFWHLYAPPKQYHNRYLACKKLWETMGENFDFTNYSKYNDATAALWRAKADEQKALKSKASALTNEMRGLLKSWRLLHPNRMPDSISFTFKVLSKLSRTKK
jgi:hypothetical protein